MKTRDNTGKFTYCGEVVMRRGYPMLYLPNHHRAKANGYVFEHIVVAEEKIGRSLTQNEDDLWTENHLWGGGARPRQMHTKPRI